MAKAASSLLVLAALAISCSQAVAAELHDIPWYMYNSAVRAATIKLCRSDNRFAHDVDCLNAESAEDRLWAARPSAETPEQPGGPRRKTLADFILSPSYWAQNRTARLGVLTSCRSHPGLSYRPDVCAAAAEGNRLDPVVHP